MKKMKKILALLLSLTIVLVALGGVTVFASDSDDVSSAVAGLTLDTENILSGLELPKTAGNGTKVTWKSSNISVISDSGEVYPAIGADKTVIMIATVTKGTAMKKKMFKVTVPQADDDKKITIYIAGDSTAANYAADHYPQSGWGEKLQNYFDSENVVVKNKAVGGRSTKWFIDEGRLDKILAEIQPGDYLFIQFGHNDQKSDDYLYTNPDSTYREYLRQYINGAREKGAIPVLLTSILRMKFDSNGNYTGVSNMGKYPDAMRAVAKEENVLLLDMAEVWTGIMKKAGPENAKNYYLFVDKDDSRFDSTLLAASEYVNGVEDSTHFNFYGSNFIANEIVKLIKNHNTTGFDRLEDHVNNYTPEAVPDHY